MENQYIINLREALLKKEYDDVFVHRCCNYAERLINKSLPVFFDEKHVSYVLKTGGITPICDYHIFYLKNCGKVREICAPSKRLKLRQRWILDNILNKVKISKRAHGFECGRSIKTNAEVHASNDYVICMDIKDFFPSINEERIVKIFQRLGYTVRVSRKLASLCCYNGALSQGAPTSPKLANIICKGIDREIVRYAKERNIIYTRYADDMTFSSNNDIYYIIDKIKSIVEKYGFSVNPKKTEYYPIGKPKFITGLVVQNGLIRIPKKFKRELKKEIHFCRKFGVLVHLENVNATHFVNYREYLYGKAYYVNMIEPDIGSEFLNDLDNLAWPEYML